MVIQHEDRAVVEAGFHILHQHIPAGIDVPQLIFGPHEVGGVSYHQDEAVVKGRADTLDEVVFGDRNSDCPGNLGLLIVVLRIFHFHS